MKPIHRLSLQIFADYHQFYIWDPELSGRRAPEDYTDDDIARRVKLAKGTVVIQPVRNMDVPVEISIWNSEPQVNLAEWQHVVIAPLQITSGTVQIVECMGRSHAELSIAPGHYTARCLFKGLDTLSADGLDGDDLYSIQLWPGEIADLTVMKSFRAR